MAKKEIEDVYIKWWLGAEITPDNNDPEKTSYSCTDVEYISQPSGFYGIVRLVLDGYGEVLVSNKGGGKRPRKSDVNVLTTKHTHAKDS